jgi:hypothetical protein
MDARFAGSAKLGERRRRRLAVESDDAPENSDRAELPASSGETRFLDNHSTFGGVAAQPFRDVALPTTLIIPVSVWKYVLLGVGCFALVGGLVAAAVLESAKACATYWGMEQLFCLPDARLAQWISNGLLLLAAQCALLIRWGRARSLKDFDGRYRVWTKAAAALLLTACSQSTGAHVMWARLVARQVSLRIQYPEEINWLAPAAAIGLWLATAIAREMKRCRASLIIFGGALFCYTVCATTVLRFWNLPQRWTLDGVLLGASLIGHVCLVLSLVVHARHVLYFCADPAQSRRKKFRIPRPHFRWPQWARRRRGVEPEADQSSSPPRKSSRRRRRKEREEPTDVPDAAAEADSSATRDKRNLKERVEDEPAPELATAARGVGPAPADTSTASDRSRMDEHDDRRDDEHVDSQYDERDDGQRSEESYDDPSAHMSKPDFRGLSKKQRRRLMQEMRDRDRSQRR